MQAKPRPKNGNESTLKKDLEISEIQKEYDVLLKASQANLDSISNLSEFYASYIKIKSNDLQSIITNLRKLTTTDKPKNSLQIIFISNLSKIYKKYEEILYNQHKINTKINNELIEPLKSYRAVTKIVYTDHLKRLNNMSHNIKRANCYFQSAKYDYMKYNYFLKNKKIDKNDVYKYNYMAKNSEKVYEYVLANYNKTIFEINEKYNELVGSINQNEESKNNFIQSSFEKFKGIIKEYDENNNEFVLFINELLKDNNIIDKDINLLINYLSKNYITNSTNNDNTLTKRIQYINYMSYKDYLLSINGKIDPYFFTFEYINQDLLEDCKINKNILTKIINEIVDTLLSNSEISINTIATLFEHLINPYVNDPNISNNVENIFLKEVLQRRNNNLFFINYANFTHFENIFYYIFITNYKKFIEDTNNSNYYLKNYKIIFKIIKFCENIYYKNIDDNYKVYLCSLRTNSIFKKPLFWKNFIQIKMANKITNFIKKNNLINSKLLITKLTTKIGNINLRFNDDKKCIINSFIKKFIKDYDMLNSSQMDLVEQFAKEEINNLLKETINGFIYFNMPYEYALDLIEDITNCLNINDQMAINYYVNYYNVSYFSIKKINSHVNRKYLESCNCGGSGNNKKFCSEYSSYNINANKVNMMFKYSLKFLTLKDCSPLLLTSKFAYSKLLKSIQTKALSSQSLTVSQRKSLYSSLLKIPTLKSTYNYQSLLSSVKNQTDYLEVDLLRKTENPNLIKQKINNIKNTIISTNLNINNYQGITYLIDFLLEYFNDDEEFVFYLLIGIFKFTDYQIIFGKDITKLNKLFYIFNRLIFLFQPEIYNCFDRNSINIDCFINKWFIYLFIFSRKFNDNLSMVNIRIIDNFIAYGWKAIMKVALFLLSYCENDIIKEGNVNMDIIKFLTRDIFKKSIFNSDKTNLKLFEECFAGRFVNNELIKLIENEYELGEKLKK